MTRLASDAAVSAILAILDADTEGHATEAMLDLLTTEDTEPEGKYADTLMLLIGHVDLKGGFDPLYRALDLCPIHKCDAAICADDDNPECASECTNKEGMTR